MKGALITAPYVVRSRSMPMPMPQISNPHEVRVRIAYVGLCGSDRELFTGSSHYLRAGQTTYPHRFGHEWVGTACPDPESSREHTFASETVVTGCTVLPCLDCTACRSGKRNLCPHSAEIGLHGFSGAAVEFLSVPATALTEVGDSQPLPRHVMIEPLATIFEAVHRVRPDPGDRIAVVGGGTMGSLATLVLSQHPVDVDVYDPASPPHLSQLGVPSATHITSRAQAGDKYDSVWECSGSPGGTRDALSLTKIGGTVALIGVPPNGTELDISSIALNGQRILGIRHGVDHYRVAAGFLRRHPEAFDSLIDCIFPLDDVAQAFERLGQPRTAPKVVLKIA